TFQVRRNRTRRLRTADSGPDARRVTRTHPIQKDSGDTSSKDSLTDHHTGALVIRLLRSNALGNNPHVLNGGVLMKNISRRKFVAAGVAVAGAIPLIPQTQAPENRVSGYDHVALPMLNTDAMVAFYKKLGFDMRESTAAVSVYVGRNMINFHRPTQW